MKFILALAVVTVLGLPSAAMASGVDLKMAQDRTSLRLRMDARAWIPVYHATGTRAASWVVRPCTAESDNVAACAFRMWFRRGDQIIVRCSGTSRINKDGSYVRPLDVACVR
jgi:hypothetical protein